MLTGIYLLTVTGRSLADLTATLDSYGIRSGSRVMVLVTKVTFCCVLCVTDFSLLYV